MKKKKIKGIDCLLTKLKTMMNKINKMMMKINNWTKIK